MRRTILLFSICLSLLTSCSEPNASDHAPRTKKKKQVTHSDRSSKDSAADSVTGQTDFDIARGIRDKEDKETGNLLFGEADKSPARVAKRYLSGASLGSVTQEQLVEAGEKALSDKDYDSAYVLGERLVEMEPGSWRGYTLRGRAGSLSVLSRTDESRAVQDLHKAIELGVGTGKMSGRPYEALAKVEFAKGDNKTALKYLDKAIEVEPTEHDYYKLRATVYSDLGMKDKARENFDLAVAVNPKNATNYFMRAKFFESIKSYDEALADYARVIEIERQRNRRERTSVSRKFRAEILIKTGRHKEAVEELTRALKMERNDDEFLLMRGKEYVKLKKYKEAENDFSKSIANAPEFAAGTYEARASLYDQLGKKNLAALDRAKAKQMRSAPAERPMF